MKNTLIIDIEERLVRYLSWTYAGRIHDKRICDEEDYTFPPGCVLFKDTGFQGFEPEKVCPYQPKKKPRHQELSAEEKAENTRIASIRILVEHVISASITASATWSEGRLQKISDSTPVRVETRELPHHS